MASRIYSYHVQVSFEKKRPECKIGDKYSGYRGSKSYKDRFCFFQDHFLIIADRGTIYKERSILSNAKNSLYEQVLKALVYYYGYANDLPKVKKYTITRKQKGKIDYCYSVCDNFLQPVSETVVKDSYLFSPAVLDIVFDDSEKANSVLIGLSYWLKSFDCQKMPFLRFDLLWRSFNCLYRYQANTDKDKDGLIEFRKFIIANSVLFTDSIAKSSSYTQNVWDSFRWSALILNDFNTVKKMKELKGFVERYSDGRIMHSLKNVIPVRESHLRTEGLWNDVESHLISNLSTKNDIDTLCILVVKYAYFVRCKNVHGEVPSNSFGLERTNLDNELDLLNDLMTTFVYEIIKNHGKLR